jgi:hypothetical protein
MPLQGCDACGSVTVFWLRSVSHVWPWTEEDEVPDIGESLAQLDQRLAEIRQQLADMAERPEALPPPPPPARRDLPPPAPGLQELAPSGHPPAAKLSERRREPVRVVGEGVGQLGTQIEQLLRIRQRLVGDVRGLLMRYQRELDECERGDVSELQSALDSLLACAPEAEQPGGLDGLLARPAFFEGTVDVAIGPATRIQTIQVLEDALARVRHVQQVYIRRWHADQLWLELTVSGGVELIGELNRVLPFSFAVRSASSREIVIRLEGER